MFNGTLLLSVLATAMIYLFATYGLVVTYRVAGVFNFALGFQAAFAAFIYWQFVVNWGFNRYLAAVLVVFVVSPIMGVAVQQMLFRKRREILTAIIVTLGLGTGIDGLIGVIWGASAEVRRVPSLFGRQYWHLGSAVITANEIGIMVVAVIVGVLIWLLMSRSRLGLQMRAAVDDPELAGATGTPYGRVGSAAWIIGVMLASIAGIFLGPEVNLEVTLLNALVVNAFAVVAFSGMTSLPMAVLGALILSYAQGLVARYPEDFSFVGAGAPDVIPFLMLGIVLLVHPAARRTLRVIAGGMQRRLRERASGSFSFAIALAVVLTVVALLLNKSWVFAGEESACFALAALSLVLLVGASGQISLCQVSFMGVGAIVLGQLSGLPWGVAMLIGVLAAAGAGLLVSLTAFRLHGLFLALITFAFAYAVNILLFENPHIISFAGLTVGRPSIFGINLAPESNFLIFCVAVLFIVMVIVGALLKGPWGRALQTLSAGDAVASVSGLSVRAWKMVVFTVSAGIAGLAGVLFASVNITVTGGSFIPEQSVFLLVFAVVGGITTPAGAVLAGVIAGASSSILNLIVSNPGSWSLVLFGLMAIQMAIMYPAGYGGMLPKSLPGLETLGAWARSRWSRRQLAAAARGAR